MSPDHVEMYYPRVCDFKGMIGIYHPEILEKDLIRGFYPCYLGPPSLVFNLQIQKLQILLFFASYIASIHKAQPNL